MASEAGVGARELQRARGLIAQHTDPMKLSGGGGWKEMPALPSGSEISRVQRELEDLPINTVDGPWASKEAYLEALYKILRREGTEGLRYSTVSLMNSPDMKDDRNTCVYTKVRVKGYLMTRIGPVCRIVFSTRRAEARIKWQQSRRLTPGTLLAISPAGDNFQTVCKIATVAQRPFLGGLDQTPPEVDILWALSEEAEIDPDEEFVMVESRNGYYEAVRHALVGLQHCASTHSSLDKYLVDGHPDIAMPPYVQESPNMNIGTLVHHLPESAELPRTNEAVELVKIKKALRSHDIRQGLPDIGNVSTLDASQREALHRIMSKELAIVQGPPGTGKTFTSVSALQVLLANRSLGAPPIVVSAQTNHALDQILLLCHETGAQILRVGGRSEHEVIGSRTIFHLRKMMGQRPDQTFRSLETIRKKNTEVIQKLLADIFSDNFLNPMALLRFKVITKAQHDSFVDSEWASPDDPKGPFFDWLGTDAILAEDIKYAVDDFDVDEEELESGQDKQYEVDITLDGAADDEEEDRLHGTYIRTLYKWTTKHRESRTKQWHAEAEKALKECDDLWSVAKYLRGAVYLLMHARLLKAILPQARQMFQKAADCSQELKKNKWARDVQLVRDRNIAIVGCTTTGLTKYRGFIAALEPRTLLVEEAAETREANVASAIYPSLQQLILVGDHQQLAPHCDIRSLGQAPYHLNVSMFERLVEGLQLPFTMLNQQRRMKPELRYILNHFYPDLTDHPEILTKRPDVPGMGGRNCWLFDHQWPEDTDYDGSKYNMKEAEMIAKFVAYLMQNGIKASQITVLTFYNGQRRAMLRTLKKEPAIHNATGVFNVHTVDSYQGEENDIVLLSLVRSPRAGHKPAVGFLEDKNRAVVAISRARCGFYVFGNMENMLRANDTSYQLWGRIWNGFADQNCIRRDKGIPIVCQNHDNEIWFQQPDDFVCNAGGCGQACGQMMPCNHDCKLRCHATPHTMLACLEPCRKTLNCGHKCQNRCTDRCFCTCHHFRVAVSSLPIPSQTPLPTIRRNQEANTQARRSSRAPGGYTSQEVAHAHATAEQHLDGTGRETFASVTARGGPASNATVDQDRLDKWANYNPVVADEQMRLARQEQAGQGNSQSTIVESFRQTGTINGRRTANNDPITQHQSLVLRPTRSKTSLGYDGNIDGHTVAGLEAPRPSTTMALQPTNREVVEQAGGAGDHGRESSGESQVSSEYGFDAEVVGIRRSGRHASRSAPVTVKPTTSASDNGSGSSTAKPDDSSGTEMQNDTQELLITF